MLYKKGQKAYYSMSNMLYSAKRTNVKNFVMAFDALVKPILMYGCSVWGLESLQEKVSTKILSGQKVLLLSEKLELKLLKYLLAAPKGTSNIRIRSEFGRLPLRFYALSQILKFYYRVKVGCKSSLLINIFHALSDISLNPFSKILTTLVDCNMIIHEPRSLNTIKTNVKKSLHMVEITLYDQWDEEIIQNRKLLTFNQVKESHDCESYITNVDDRFLRKYLSMIRLSCHPLKIETGRYRNIPQHMRLCTFCDLDEVEDEFHMIMNCTLYQNLRNDFFSRYNNFGNMRWNSANSPHEKFKIILQPSDANFTITTCQFLKSCFSLRNQTEYTSTT